MEQLKDELQRLHVDIARVLERIDEITGVLALERWWRRISVGFIVIVLVSVGAWFSYDRQEACDRSNASREQLRAGPVATWDTAWDVLVTEEGPETDAKKATLLAALEEDQASRWPPRDCSWPV